MSEPESKVSPMKIVLSNIIKMVVCQYYHMDITELNAKTRKQRTVIARQMCIAFIKKYIPNMTVIQIALLFDQDHSNIVYSYKHISNLLLVDKEIKEDYRVMQQQVHVQIESLKSVDGQVDGYDFFDLNLAQALKIGNNQFIIFKGIPAEQISVIKQYFPDNFGLVEIMESGVSILQKKSEK